MRYIFFKAILLCNSNYFLSRVLSSREKIGKLYFGNNCFWKYDKICQIYTKFYNLKQLSQIPNQNSIK